METQESRKESVMRERERPASVSNASGGTSKVRNTELAAEAR